MSAPTTATVLAGITAAAAVGSTAYTISSSMGANAAKIPDAIAGPAAPSVNEAQSEAQINSGSAGRQGALANLLAPLSSQSTPNASLKTLLGG